MAREIAIASEDLVTGTVTAVTDSGVTVSYTLSDGSAVEVRRPFTSSSRQFAGPTAACIMDTHQFEQQKQQQQQKRRRRNEEWLGGTC